MTPERFFPTRSIPGLVSENQIPTYEEVADFCKGCDLSRDRGLCAIADSFDQARYAFRGLCGWAEQDGVRVVKTKLGFEQHPLHTTISVEPKAS